jgi:hypothetical protein
VPSSERDKRLRAELAAELGWYPADRRRVHRPAARRRRPQEDRSRPREEWAHLTELARQREIEAKGRAEVADLYE